MSSRLIDAATALLGLHDRGAGTVIVSRLSLAKHKGVLEGYLWHIDKLREALAEAAKEHNAKDL